MTAQEKLHAIEMVIRKALPRLMELREGCYFIDRTFGYRKVKFLHKCQKDNKEYVLDEDGVVCWHDYYDKTIIGHDILLSDVLEWLNSHEIRDLLNKKTSNLDATFEYVYVNGGNITLVYHRSDGGISLATRTGKWDLSKNCLADQSEELWKFLYDIIK